MTLCTLCAENTAELRIDITEMHTDSIFYVKNRICKKCAIRLTKIINEVWGE